MAESTLNVHKVVKIERDLSAFHTCDLVQAWSLLKPYIEKQVGKDWFACIPYVTDSASYDVTSVFVKTNQEGSIGRRYRTYHPLGKIENLLLKENSYEVWHDISDRIPETTQSTYPSPIEIILSDDTNKVRVSATFNTITAKTCPREFSPLGRVMFDVALSRELAAANKVYFINEVVQSNGIEIRIHVNGEDKVYIQEGAQPIAFHYSKYLLSKRKMITQEQMVPKVTSARTNWVLGALQSKAPSIANVPSTLMVVSGLEVETPVEDEPAAEEVTPVEEEKKETISAVNLVSPSVAPSVAPLVAPSVEPAAALEPKLTESFPAQAELESIIAN